MVVELLNLHAQWMEIEENRPPLHLIFIEEPEAHLHAQLQQVFIREVLNILVIDGDDTNYYKSQLVVTTHSAHILYERGFRPIRYFRRCIGTNQSSEVLNLSVFYDNTAKQTRDFLERYLKLTHCDLFFADAAILVEGNVERLLIPQMIEKVAEPLKSTYLTILEIGGAFGYRFRSLIEFLGITALIVTDIDSVIGPGPTNGGLKEAAASAESIEEQEETDETEDEEDGEDNNAKKATACMAHIPDAVTTNQTLIQWLPAKNKIADLLQASPEERTQRRTDKCQALIRVVYQTPIEVTWRDEKKILTGRTLEEAFAFENLAWCQHKDRKNLNLRFARNDRLTLDLLTEKIHKRIKSTSFKKTDFALALLMQDPKEWSVPTYISRGLQWLKDEIAPLPQQEQEAIEEVVE